VDANAVSNLLILALSLLFIVWIAVTVWRMLLSNAIPDTMPGMVTRPEPAWKQRWACKMGFHEWVGRGDLGGKPDSKIVNSPRAVDYFFEFAAPVCKYCPSQLPPRK